MAKSERGVLHNFVGGGRPFKNARKIRIFFMNIRLDLPLLGLNLLQYHPYYINTRTISNFQNAWKYLKRPSTSFLNWVLIRVTPAYSDET